MKEMLWKAFAWIVSRRPVADYLINRAKRTEYFHLSGYMNRWWLFNRYSEIGSQEKIKPRFSWLPSVRIHHILRKDNADHPHDHPWQARTIILKGSYVENTGDSIYGHLRNPGDTRAINFGEFHHISHVTTGGVYTMFISWKYIGTWGFLVDGEKVPYKQYLSEHPQRA